MGGGMGVRGYPRTDPVAKRIEIGGVVGRCGPVNQWGPGNLTPVGAFGKATHRFERWSGRIGRGRPDRVRHAGPSSLSTVVRTDASQGAGSASHPNATPPPRLMKIRFACMSPTTERRFALRPRHTGDCGT